MTFLVSLSRHLGQILAVREVTEPNPYRPEFCFGGFIARPISHHLCDHERRPHCKGKVKARTTSGELVR